MDIKSEGTVEIGANRVGNRGSKNTYPQWLCTCYRFTNLLENLGLLLADDAYNL